MDISNQLDTIKIANFNNKINNELNYMKTVSILTPFANGQAVNLEERIKVLEQIIKQPGLYQNSVQKQRDHLFKEIDKYTYKKQWNKLPPFHKTVKINEYLLEHIKDKKVRDALSDKLADHALKGQINNKKYVVYDPNEEKILLLPCLKIIKDEKDGTYTYKLEIV
ncbi:MAG: hypothetical protein Barrevirus5_15 [Barrevirus sp.]|uniref:Uncharacterized protein n=1 Tax=Barrevirus sp. TaxID=2487763 RepID=A0A3G4ZPZ0_9VIRU|nr:MAG: hypothetical protein Barrevirus5_15 [Barrevirus sp.]